MKKTLLAVASAVLAFTLISCANSSGGGKRAVTNGNSGGANTKGSDEGDGFVSLSEISGQIKKVLRDGETVTISGNSIAFQGTKNAGILFPENVEAIRFTLPTVDDFDKTMVDSMNAPNSQNYTMGLITVAGETSENFSTRLIGFPFHFFDGCNNYEALKHQWRTNADTSNGLEGFDLGGYGNLGGMYQPASDLKLFRLWMEDLIGCGVGNTLEMALDTTNKTVKITNKTNDYSLTTNKYPTSCEGFSGGVERLGLCRSNAAKKDITLENVQVKLRNK